MKVILSGIHVPGGKYNPVFILVSSCNAREQRVSSSHPNQNRTREDPEWINIQAAILGS
jgi:hypothetical protein